MKTLHILVVTRNRLAGLLDSLGSIKRLAAHPNSLSVNIEVTVQDNSDVAIPESILRYFSKHMLLRYNKTDRLLPMSQNWDQGLTRVLSQDPDYVVVLADRRLVSANLINAVRHIEDRRLPFICFDHQDTWISSSQILKKNYSHTVQLFDRGYLLGAIASARVAWHSPMLLNCVVTSQFMLELARRYGSFADGSSPDMNFLARVADIGIESFCTYDAPCIVTNARHAATSNGSSALKSGTIHETEHTRLSGLEVYPIYMENFVAANITGSLARYWTPPQMRQLINVPRFFESALLELSYPKSAVAYLAMKESLYKFANDFYLDAHATSLIDSVRHIPASEQPYPISSHSDLSNAPSLDLLSTIEIMS